MSFADENFRNKYEERVGNNFSYAQVVNGEVKHLALCPRCDNPVAILGIYKKINVAPHARHTKATNIPNIVQYNEYKRLAQFIEYKAKLAGITIEYVNPAYTSQTCPICGSVHHADDRHYSCQCGYHIHRDILGAINICNSTEFDGNRQTA